jgi:hypothetical protein
MITVQVRELPMQNANVIEKIQKLLALGESPNQYEAEMALKKAMELMDLHNIEQSDLNIKEEIISGVYLEQGRIPAWVKLLSAYVAKFCSCKVLISGGGGGSKIRVWGKKSHQEIFSYTMGYLVEAIDRLTRENANGKGKSYCNSYRQGLTQNLINRIDDMLKAPEVEEKAIVLRDKNLSEIDQFLVKEGFKIRTERVNVGGQGFDKGLKDGDKIRLSKALKD